MDREEALSFIILKIVTQIPKLRLCGLIIQTSVLIGKKMADGLIYGQNDYLTDF